VSVLTDGAFQPNGPLVSEAIACQAAELSGGVVIEAFEVT
jgi:hypothetical protein